MRFGKGLAVAVLGLSSCLAWPVLADYSGHPGAQAFAAEVASRHGFSEDEVLRWLAGAERRDKILELIARPAERTLTWAEYRRIFITEDRIEQGLAFWETHERVLQRAESEFGVPAELIVAVLGVETLYGRHKGGHRVLDALATLAFDYPPRAAFFRGQLEQYLLLVREQGFDPFAVHGSYAGAMGYGQFIPGSYRHYAVDFDGDGVVDIIDNVVDAIGSVANYFRVHGWSSGEPVRALARLSPGHDASLLDPPLRRPTTRVAELDEAGITAREPLPGDLSADAFTVVAEDGAQVWLGLHNFYVITRYNRSRLYAMAVQELAEKLLERRT